MYTVYLVGQITADPLTYEWRKEVEDYFEINKHVKIINPCNSVFNQKALDNDDTEENGYSKKSFRERGIALLPHKDREYVRKSNIAFVNLNMYSPEKPVIGSFFELAWYFDAPEKMVIGIFDGDPTKDFQCHHPFVKSTIHVWVKDTVKACKLLERFMDIRID
jgi:hypothetical protein